MGFNCALDGPSGSGKSTVAKAVAKKLGFLYVDTGALYRSIGLYVTRKGKDTKSASEVVPLLDEINVDLAYKDGSQVVILNGEDVSGEIRTPSISMAASNVSAIPEVRSFLLELQRSIAQKNDIIMDGRDIGTVILPNADVKVFMTASAEERAKRRYKEMVEKGVECTYESILSDINERDYNDSHRETAPLKKADDAVELDTSNMTIDEVVGAITKMIEEKRNFFQVNKKPKWTLGLLLYGFLRLIVSLVLRIIYNIKVEGKENIPHSGGCVIASNHRAWLDVLLIAVSIRKPNAYMAKAELFKNPIISFFLKLLKAFPVTRGSGDHGVIDTSVEFIEKGYNLLLFPEGTRSKDGTLGKPKSGVAYIASQSKAPVCPVGIKFDGKLTFRKKITITFGKTISPEELKCEAISPSEMRRVRDIIFNAIKELVE